MEICHTYLQLDSFADDNDVSLTLVEQLGLKSKVCTQFISLSRRLIFLGQTGQFLDVIGGPEHVGRLLEPFEALCAMHEVAVREQVCFSTCLNVVELVSKKLVTSVSICFGFVADRQVDKNCRKSNAENERKVSACLVFTCLRVYTYGFGPHAMLVLASLWLASPLRLDPKYRIWTLPGGAAASADCAWEHRAPTGKHLGGVLKEEANY